MWWSMQFKKTTHSHKTSVINQKNNRVKQHRNVKLLILVLQLSDLYVCVKIVDKESM